jgi:SpoVK/Ycf46/Vps4 family AAA+-type ATPase
MSNTKQILAMIRSRAKGDDEQLYSIALQVAAAEARKGHRTTAEEIRAAVDEARDKTSGGASVAISFAKPRGDLQGLLELRRPSFALSDVVLSTKVRSQIDGLVREQMKRDWLREHKKYPRKRALCVGPPGSGKTMTAEALAHTLKIPLFVIRLDALITRFMGETAAKLRLVFDEVNKRRGVYLFDEFDAVGSRRDATNDVAEMRRVLNSFLQFMEETNSTDSLVIAATNYPELLDRALLRRFDTVLEFVPPTKDQVKQLIKSNLRPIKHPRIAWSKIADCASGLSQSEIVAAAEDAVKTAILDQRDSLGTQHILDTLLERHAMKDAFNKE